SHSSAPVTPFLSLSCVFACALNHLRTHRQAEGYLKVRLTDSVFQEADQFGGGGGEPAAPPRDHIDVARQIQLAHFHFFHPAVVNLPGHAHTRHDGDAHAHLHEALDAFHRGHFDGHV